MILPLQWGVPSWPLNPPPWPRLSETRRPTDNTCDDCEKEGYVLTRLRETYPDLRVYSFDYNIGLSAVNTLISVNKVKNELPAIIIKDQTYYGFKSVEDIEKIVPELAKIKATVNATSTKVKN